MDHHSILTVSQLTSQIKDCLEGGFPDAWVEGEVSNFKLQPSGHAYFTLKDATGSIRGIIFRSYYRFIRFQPKDGLHVIVRGHLTVYEPRGEYQLVVDYAEPKGVGALQLAFEQLKEKLSREGLFDERRKRSLPLLPRKVGIVTSPTGAAIRDILTVLSRRYFNMDILIYPVRVQGDGAGAEIASAIEEMNVLGGMDVLIVGRGGGSLEDLWPFNDEAVARAAASSRIPVISAVGHETDFTILDFVADLRAPTPSAAAEMVVKSKEELTSRLRTLEDRLTGEARKQVQERRHRVIVAGRSLIDPAKQVNFLLQRLDDLLLRLTGSGARLLAGERQNVAALRRLIFSNSPAERIRVLGQHRDNLEGRLARAIESSMTKSRGRFGALAAVLGGMSPLAVLARGYAIVRQASSDAILKEAENTAPGDRLAVRLSKGELTCVVEEIRSPHEIH